MPYVNKNHQREMKIWFKHKTRPKMNFELNEKPFRKKSDPRNQKKRKFPHVNKKPQARNFCSNTVFSLHLEIRAKKFHAAKPLAFSLHFLFRRDQNHYSNLTSKIMKCVNRSFKRQRHKYVSKCFCELHTCRLVI